MQETTAFEKDNRCCNINLQRISKRVINHTTFINHIRSWEKQLEHIVWTQSQSTTIKKQRNNCVSEQYYIIPTYTVPV